MTLVFRGDGGHLLDLGDFHSPAHGQGRSAFEPLWLRHVKQQDFYSAKASCWRPQGGFKTKR
jgi:hypothetical protein